MKANVLMTLLLSAIVMPAAASEAVDRTFIFPAFQVAQLSPEERRVLRERWEQSSPEDRMEIRRQFQDRLQAAPQQEREPRRQQQRDGWPVRIPTPPNPAEFAQGMVPFGGNFGGNVGGNLNGNLNGNFSGNFGGNFGSGFEQRRPEPADQDQNAPNFDPRSRFNAPAGRNRR